MRSDTAFFSAAVIYLKFVMRLRWSLHQMLQVLQLNMFERRPLQDLFTTPSLPAPSGSQLSLAWS